MSTRELESPMSHKQKEPGIFRRVTASPFLQGSQIDKNLLKSKT